MTLWFCVWTKFEQINVSSLLDSYVAFVINRRLGQSVKCKSVLISGFCNASSAYVYVFCFSITCFFDREEFMYKVGLQANRKKCVCCPCPVHAARIRTRENPDPDYFSSILNAVNLLKQR